MRGAGILAYGGPIQRLELPEPEISDPYQLLIAVHAAGVGNWDDLVRTGSWDVGGTPPLVLVEAESGRAGRDALYHQRPG
jgi:NADPH:quinone reductase-like Zn-dependent oxidoreductase